MGAGHLEGYSFYYFSYEIFFLEVPGFSFFFFFLTAVTSVFNICFNDVYIMKVKVHYELIVTTLTFLCPYVHVETYAHIS